MSAAIAFEPQPQTITAEVFATRDPSAAAAGAVRHVGRRAIVVATETPLAPGAHAWIALTLPEGPAIRPLVQVTGDSDGAAACRIVHLFPDQRRAFEAWHQDRATPSGY